MVRCDVASVFRISSHRSPPHYLASDWQPLMSLHVRFYHLVCMKTSTLGNLYTHFWHLSSRKMRFVKKTQHMKELPELVEASQSGDGEAECLANQGQFWRKMRSLLRNLSPMLTVEKSLIAGNAKTHLRKG